MLLAFLYTLGFLLIVPYIMGYEPLGIFGIVVGCLGAWMVIGIAKLCESGKTEDEEILGTYVTEARYYEPWTEKIEHEDEETGEKTYETVEHDEDWEATVAEGDIIPIDEEDYQYYVRLFGNEDEEEADHYGESEGEIIDPGYSTYTTWPGTYETASYEYVSRAYKNPTLRASSVYASEKLDEEAIKKYHLQAYGRKGLYGTVKGEDVEQLEDEIRDYNCWSRDKNIKLNFILLENAKSTQGIYWQQYWQNGKRNTINAVVGVTSKHKIEWAHVFGWQNEAACIKLRNFIVGLDTLEDITSNFSQVEHILKENYQLPNFGQYDFGVGQFPLKGTLIALTICLGVFCGLFCKVPDPMLKAVELIETKQWKSAKIILQQRLDQLIDRDLQNISKDQMRWTAFDSEETKAKFREVADIYNAFGCIYLSESNGIDSLEAFRKAIFFLPDENNKAKLSMYYHNRGKLMREAQEYQKAVKDYEKSIKLSDTLNQGTACQLYAAYEKLNYRTKMRQLARRYQKKYGDITTTCDVMRGLMQMQIKPLYTDDYERLGIVRLINRILK